MELGHIDLILVGSDIHSSLINSYQYLVYLSIILAGLYFTRSNVIMLRVIPL